MSILSLGCSNKSIEKEMKMPMLFDTKEQAEKEAYKFGCEGCLLYTSPSPRDSTLSRMPSSA